MDAGRCIAKVARPTVRAVNIRAFFSGSNFGFIFKKVCALSLLELHIFRLGSATRLTGFAGAGILTAAIGAGPL
jgi:hypothetical protein